MLNGPGTLSRGMYVTWPGIHIQAHDQTSRKIHSTWLASRSLLVLIRLLSNSTSGKLVLSLREGLCLKWNAAPSWAKKLGIPAASHKSGLVPSYPDLAILAKYEKMNSFPRLSFLLMQGLCPVYPDIEVTPASPILLSWVRAPTDKRKSGLACSFHVKGFSMPPIPNDGLVPTDRPTKRTPF
jgi:hypothetical protein